MSTVNVQGFKWCKDAPVTIGLSSLTAKILCEKHNGALSVTDTAARDFTGAFRAASELDNARAAIPSPWPEVKYQINGNALERWFVKTTINFCFEKEFRIGHDSSKIGQPSDRLVRTAYGLQPFEGAMGLYFATRVGESISSTDAVAFAPLVRHSEEVLGGLFGLRGFRFLIFLESELPASLAGIELLGKDLGGDQLRFHPSQFIISSTQVVTIEWA